MLPLASSLPMEGHVPIILDAMVIGMVHVDHAVSVAASLRAHKMLTAAKHLTQAAGTRRDGWLDQAVASLEIALILPQVGGAFPGLHLAAGSARFGRTVRNMAADRHEVIGPLEQTTLWIAYATENFRPKEMTHCELAPTAIFSIVASLTPFCDFNQSPRNMYQCQMGKQTMGTPYHAFPHRVDTKTYRIHTPQVGTCMAIACRPFLPPPSVSLSPRAIALAESDCSQSVVRRVRDGRVREWYERGGRSNRLHRIRYGGRNGHQQDVVRARLWSRLIVSYGNCRSE